MGNWIAAFKKNGYDYIDNPTWEVEESKVELLF